MLLVEKVLKKLASWKGKLLSLAGWATLLNSVISPIIASWMSNFSIPSYIIRRLDRMRRAFLWSGEDTTTNGKYLLNWNLVCRPKELGGMGITNLLVMLNRVLLSKWWWKLFNNSYGAWSSLVTATYQQHGPLTLNTSQPQQQSSLWKAIQMVKPLFQALVRFQLGNGLNVSFWNDSCLFPKPIQGRFLSLFNLSCSKAISIVEAYNLYQYHDYWPTAPTHCNLGLQHLRQVMSILEILDRPETIEWKWFPTKAFSAK